MVEEIRMNKEESSEEYELLIVSDDENFVDDNRELFEGLNGTEKLYLVS